MPELECSFIQWLVDLLADRDAITACCGYHDLDYAAGILRSLADQYFYNCLEKINGWIAAVFSAFVSAFGWIFYRRARKNRNNP